MTILSRHAGLASTKSDKLLSHLQEQLIPRVKPFLDRLRNEERRRVDERRMREEQDRAYREAMNRDKERIEGKIREEKELQRKLEEDRIAEETRARVEEEEQAKQRAWDEKRMTWRRYMRRLVNDKEARSTGVRIGLKLPDGRRAIHVFDANESLTAMYAFVDSQLIPEDLSPSSDPELSPRPPLQGESAIHEEISRHVEGALVWWGFKLALTYPRKEVPWKRGIKIGAVQGLESGAQLVVEMVSVANGNGKARRIQESSDGGSDGYDTESDED